MSQTIYLEPRSETGPVFRDFFAKKSDPLERHIPVYHIYVSNPSTPSTGGYEWVVSLVHLLFTYIFNSVDILSFTDFLQIHLRHKVTRGDVFIKSRCVFFYYNFRRRKKKVKPLKHVKIIFWCIMTTRTLQYRYSICWYCFVEEKLTYSNTCTELRLGFRAKWRPQYSYYDTTKKSKIA